MRTSFASRTAALAVAVLAPAVASASAVGDCHIAAYRLADGSLVDIAPSEGETLRWRRFDGASGALARQADGRWASTLGWTGRPDGRVVAFSPCAEGKIRFGQIDGRRIAFDTTETIFQGEGVKLAGRLVMPKGRGKVPVVVLVHGSEHDSGRDFYPLQRLLPAEGIGVFVYDKRGTGASGGQYTQDFQVLARDAVAAMRQARKLAGPRAGRVGYQGGSQGGWVAPLAAALAPVDFVVVSFGLAVSPLEEDQQEVALEMRLAGHGLEDTAKALEVARAAETVMASGFTRGFAEFDALRARYRGEPWYKDLHGNLTRFLLPYDEAQLREKGEAFKFGTPWDYDSMPVLRAAKAPELWILGEDDLDAPSAETARRIRGLQAAGRPFTLAMVPHAEHGMTEYEVAPNGERLSTRYAPGYFAMMADFVRTGRLAGPYGQAVLSGPAAPKRSLALSVRAPD